MPPVRYTAPGAGSAAPAAHAASHISGGSDPFTSAQFLEAAAMRLRETSGPTILTAGTIADGQFLKRSGTTLISAAASTVAGDVKSNSTLVNRTNAGDGQTLSLPAGALAADGDFVELAATADVSSAGGGAIAIVFGATTILSYTPGAIGRGVFRATVIRVGATSQVAYASITYGSTVVAAAIASPAETLSGAITVKTANTGTITSAFQGLTLRVGKVT